MVCKVGQTCQIEYNLFHGAKDKILPTDKLPLHESTRGKDLYDYIEERCQIQPDSFKLYLLSTGKLIDLSVMKDKTMSEAGVDFSFDRESTTEQKHILLVVDPTYTFSQNQVGCFSAYSQPPPSPNHSSVWGEDNIDFKSRIKPKTCYVGLVNQAMTCYLNSLLQALYMTPEFRNALYNWEYIEKSEKDEANSIPFQLQKLFLNLQTSTKSAVETTALTKSFGWDSTEAWQQHDIQELCRVMFDALEQKFKNTEQADLINRLYEGKMTDYVKCLECGTEKSREDTFLDIPLPVRPFGSSVAYNSVEEALRAFVQYETLEGINQYHCEKCNKKCNAHKGLKFTKFPYLLTLHLKRFDFDFKTFHRIKLNDKVTFPDVLNLNSLIYSTEEKEVLNGDETTDIPTGDDNPITDDSTNHDTAACENSLPNSNHTSSPDQDDDEGIETSSNGPSTSNCVERNHENDKKSSSNVVKGPYNYELFSIMIHSGSASGGHYYAYIKDFRTQEWLCFNDQNVTQITHDDIQKTYGGGLSRSYLNGACSSTNAYMLMYRQIDPARNTLPMQVQDFPKHIQALLMKVKEKEENDKKMRERDDIDNKTADRNYYESTCGVTSRLKVYCQYPNEDKKRFDRITIQPNVTLAELTRDIYKHFGLEGVVNLSQCRLVVYDSCADSVIYNFEGKENEIFDRIRGHKLRRNYLLLEIQDKDKIFEPYLCSDITTKVFVIDVPRKEFIQGPLNIQVSRTSTVRDYVQLLSKTVNIEPEDITIAIRKRGSSDHQKNVTPVTNLKFLKNDDTELQAAGFYNLVNVFVYTMKDAKHKHFMVAINEMTQQLENIITLSIKLPPTPSKEILEEYSISTSEVNSVDNEKPASSSTVHQTVENSSKENANEPQCDVAGKCNEDAKSEKSTEENQVCARNASPQLGEGEEWHTPEQSNSEDSSLSDSDKTLVGDAPEDDGFPLPYFPSSANNRGMKMLDGVELENWENVIDESEYYFKATEYTNNNKNYLKVIVDKRMLFNTFKKKLEPYVGVPSKYFKICRYVVICGETECGCLPMQFISYEDDEILSIKYGRSLQNRKFPIKVYHFYLNAAEPHKLLFDWTISKDMTVGQVKREILAELKRRYHVDIPFERCRLRKKCYVLPMEVYLNHQTCEEIKLYMHHEICLQELPDVDPVTSVDQVIVFVRRWSGGKLGLIQEIVLDENTVDEILKKLSQISDIPEKHIDVAKKRGLSHFTTYMRVPDDLDWNAFTTCVDPLAEDGSVFLYRDNRESTNETQEGYNSISFRGRYLSAATGTRYSARKEKALRIHVDDE